MGHLVTQGVVGHLNKTLLLKIMRILGALGLGLTILILRSMVPEIFQAIENILLQFFHLLGLVMSKAQIWLDHLPTSP